MGGPRKPPRAGTVLFLLPGPAMVDGSAEPARLALPHLLPAGSPARPCRNRDKHLTRPGRGCPGCVFQVFGNGAAPPPNPPRAVIGSECPQNARRWPLGAVQRSPTPIPPAAGMGRGAEPHTESVRMLTNVEVGTPFRTLGMRAAHKLHWPGRCHQCGPGQCSQLRRSRRDGAHGTTKPRWMHRCVTGDSAANTPHRRALTACPRARRGVGRTNWTEHHARVDVSEVFGLNRTRTRRSGPVARPRSRHQGPVLSICGFAGGWPHTVEPLCSPC